MPEGVDSYCAVPRIAAEDREQKYARGNHERRIDGDAPDSRDRLRVNLPSAVRVVDPVEALGNAAFPLW